MAKNRVVHRCRDCGATTPRWAGRCPTCDAWNSLDEEVEEPVAGGRAAAATIRPAATATPLDAVDIAALAPISTGVAELDRVLGGGLVPGSVTLVGGEPGIGKSTLVLQALAHRSGGVGHDRALLVTAEESRAQVRARAERLGALAPDLWLLPETALDVVVARMEAVHPAVVAVDSIQTLHDPALDGAPGSVGQVRECAHKLVRLAKDTGTTVLLVGHVTKDG